MLRRFLHNTAISAVAYGVAGVLGLFAVGLIARSYGVAVLGLIVLARSFLPTGFLSLIDFGVSETVTQVIARGRMGDWTTAGEKVSLLVLIAGAAGVIAGGALWATALEFATLFKVAPEQTSAFVSILRVTALLMPITFLGLVIEGGLKGFEEYAWLRITEVGSNVLYVLAVCGTVWLKAPFEWVGYSYVATVVAKYVVLAFVVRASVRCTPLRFRACRPDNARDVLYRSWLMFYSRIGGFLQQTIIPFAIGVLYTPAEVGAYDVITRLPRFLKTTMGPLYSAILPISTHIEENTDVRRLQLLGRNGLVLPGAIVIPALVVVALFSEDILKVWVGVQYADQWPWMALSLVVPAASAILSAGTTALMVRTDFLRLITRLVYLQVFVQYLVTAATLAWLHERAFILGWVVSYLIFTPFIARRILVSMSLPASLFWTQLSRQIFVAGILSVMAASYKFYFSPHGLVALMMVGGLGCVAAWTLAMVLILSGGDRAMLGRFARTMTQRQQG